jgi:hypothetical protein
MKPKGFLKQLRERMAECGLELHLEKKRLIEFGRFAEGNRKRDGAGKRETSNFLGSRTSAARSIRERQVHGEAKDGQEAHDSEAAGYCG